MDENELAEFLFELLVEGGIELATGIPISPVGIFLRFVKWLDEGNPVHQRAASKAISRYIDYNNLPRGYYDYGDL